MQAEFRRCLIELDIAGARKLWAETRPHFVQPKSDEETLVILHSARTQTKSLALKIRAYSHRWLIEHGYPSGLPDELKPKAERFYPRVVDAVGISVKATADWRKPIAKIIQGAMSDAVMDAYAEGRTEVEFVKARMAEARARITKQIG